MLKRSKWIIGQNALEGVLRLRVGSEVTRTGTALLLPTPPILQGEEERQRHEWGDCEHNSQPLSALHFFLSPTPSPISLLYFLKWSPRRGCSLSFIRRKLIFQFYPRVSSRPTREAGGGEVGPKLRPNKDIVRLVGKVEIARKFLILVKFLLQTMDPKCEILSIINLRVFC